MKISLRATTCGLILALSAGIQPASAEVYATLASNSSVSSATYDPLQSPPSAAPSAAADASSSGSCGCTSGNSCSNCDSCGNVCYTNRANCWSCTIGVEATYLQPTTHDETLFVPGAFNAADFLDIEKFEAAPRVWVGFENENGRGIRARYWQYDAEDHFTDLALIPIAGSTLAAEELETYTIDLEYTRRGQHGCWDVLGSFGVRNASLQRWQGSSNFDQLSGLTLATSNDNSFDGTGLTFALEGRRPLGREGLNFYGNVRGSVLWGTTKMDAVSTVFAGGTTANQLAIVNEDTTMWIFESQVGLEWNKYLKCFCGTAFARFLFEYQTWNVDESGFDLAQSVGGTTLVTSSLSNDVDFLGFTVAIGVSR